MTTECLLKDQLRKSPRSHFCASLRDRYSRLLQLIQDGNSLLRETIYQLKKYFHKLVHWMLEEEDSIIFGKTSKGKIRDQKFGKQE